MSPMAYREKPGAKGNSTGETSKKSSGDGAPKCQISPLSLSNVSCLFTGARNINSEAWRPPQFQEKRSRSEKAILGALGEFSEQPLEFRNFLKVILGRLEQCENNNSRINSRSDSRNLWEPHEDFHLPFHSQSFFLRIGVVPPPPAR